MTSPRTYSAGTRAALAHLSRGQCYNPDCERQEPIIRFVAGEPHVDYHIAHIRDARPGNRYIAAMTDDDRRAFANLVLLCKPCHDLVDKNRPQDYPIERLERWKLEREERHGDALAAVRTADEAGLAELLRATFRAAIGNPEISVRNTAGVLSIVDGGVPRLLPLEPATVFAGAAASPTSLLKARSGIVPFTVHEDLRRTLLDWCLDGAAFSARLLGGKGGAGKTRLGVQLCEDLAPSGWVTGMLTQLLHQPEMEALVAAPTARLVVVDYAEARADQVPAWLPRLAALATPQKPVRALLLVRAGRAQDWAGALRGHGDAFSAMLDAVAVDVLDARPPSEAERRRLFSAAARAFTTRARAGELALPEPPENLDDAAFARPLLVVVKAYLDVHGGGNAQTTRSGLLEELLHHEDRYWRSTGSGAPEDPVLRRRVVALATLAGAGSETEAAERLRLLPDLADASEERRRALARWAHEQYEGGLEWWNPVEPDLVAEHLIASTFHDHPAVLEGVLVDQPDLLIRPLRLYARAVPDHPQLAAALKPILSRGLRRLCQLAIDQAATVIDREVILGDTTVAVALARWVAVMDVDLIALTDAVDLLPPRLDLILNRLAIDLYSQLADQLRRLAAANPGAEPDLARSLNSLSIYLRAVGRRDEGLDAIEEAVVLRRRLAAANHDFAPDLAMSLNNLSVSFGDVGRHPEALAASKEAVALRRLHAESNPAEYESALAASLNNLSGHLGEAGRHDEGLVVVRETVALYRRLAANDPARYTPDLALSLENLAQLIEPWVTRMLARAVRGRCQPGPA